MFLPTSDGISLPGGCLPVLVMTHLLQAVDHLFKALHQVELKLEVTWPEEQNVCVYRRVSSVGLSQRSGLAASRGLAQARQKPKL